MRKTLGLALAGLLIAAQVSGCGSSFSESFSGDAGATSAPEAPGATGSHKNLLALSFEPPQILRGGRRLDKVAVSDFNSDGQLDLVGVDELGDSAVVALGRGDGTFSPGLPTDVGDTPLDVVASDFDRDGLSDLIVANEHGLSLVFLKGQGDGTFEQPRPLVDRTYLKFISLALADLNGDEQNEFAAGDAHFGTARGYRLADNGSLERMQPASSGVDAIATQDLKQLVLDGVSQKRPAALFTVDSAKNELAFAYSTGPRRDGLLNDFFFKRQVGEFPVAVAAADFNKDGADDPVTANEKSDDLSLFLSTDLITSFRPNRDNPFQNERRLRFGARLPQDVTTGDLNRDGAIDIVVGHIGGFSVLLNLGDGSFQEPLLFGGGNLTSVELFDLNNDGRLDLIGTDPNRGAFVVRLQQDPFESTTLATRRGPSDVKIFDSNGDGHLDIAVAERDSNLISLRLGNGDGTFSDPTNLSVNGIQPTALALADLNGDNLLDIVATNGSSLASTVSVFLNSAAGAFSQLPPFPVGRSPVAVSAGDLNGDGNPDVTTANREANSLTVALGNGDGTFQQARTNAVGMQPVAVTRAIIAGGTIIDLVCANFGSNTISLLRGDGTGRFSPLREIPVGSQPSALLEVDINRDSRPDLVVANRGSNSLSLLFNTADTVYTAPIDVKTGVQPVALAVNDFTRDGIPDLVSANSGDDTVSLLQGNGDGTFKLANNQQVGQTPVALATGDLNEDSVPDIVVANQRGNTITILLSRGN